MYGYIYLTENLIDGKCYIGKRTSKKFDHKYKGSGVLIRRAIKKYGWDNFVCTPIEWCSSKEELNNSEIYWIEKCNAVESPYFYNMKPGGEGGSYTGWHQTDFQKKRTAELNKGRKHTIEEKELMKQNHKDFTRGNHPLAKKVICITTNKIYACINDAAEDTGIERHKIAKCCKGITFPKSPIGLEFKFYKEV